MHTFSSYDYRVVSKNGHTANPFLSSVLQQGGTYRNLNSNGTIRNINTINTVMIIVYKIPLNVYAAFLFTAAAAAAKVVSNPATCKLYALTKTHKTRINIRRTRERRQSM